MNLAKLVKKHDRMTTVHLHIHSRSSGQGGYWGKVKQSTLKFAGQNS